MTTIAWDGKTLAADRQAATAGLRRSRSKIRDCGEYMFAGCGATHQLALIEVWIAHGVLVGDSPKFEEGGGWGLAVRKSTGECFHVVGDTPVVLVKVEDPFMADGSGRDFAFSAMAFGRDAVDAVKFAAKYNVDTGDRVDTYVAHPDDIATVQVSVVTMP